MANCPNCKKHLRLTDWKQHCPYCGANIIFYDMQERLMQDADKAEVQYYYFQKKLDRLKSSFVGSKLAIARIVTSILPIAALFLPIVKCNFKAPLPEKSGNLNVLDIYEMFEDIDFGAVLGGITGGNIAFGVSVVLFLLSVVLILVHLVLLTLACSPKGKARSYILNIAMLSFSVISALCFALSPAGSFASGTLGVGTYLYIALFILNFVIEIIIYKKGIEIHHKQCYVGGIPIEEYFKMVEDGIPQEEIRREMYRRLDEIQAKKDVEAASKKKEEENKSEVNANG